MDGKIVLDLGKEEDNFGQADLPMGILAKSGKIVLMQMDGDLSQEEFDQATALIMDATKRIYEIQREALAGKYRALALERGGE